ncbi:hypothetical protein HMPREF0650_0668 [Hoylesella buccalis ATCC 35310]|uniref:Uncharacterized protein n=1 Tax=Hoylesella buccalis ATCC 35310 TaxID=679190 RepID=D1W836_9BACT|nr:hypothetical protein [Hoylesella buccalis]EFA91398.1 hypothetical protein HMPREF0650_0668 [Hoylesella buccalis ATCC 35310]
MGLFSTFSNVNKINILLKQIEPKIQAIEYEANSLYPNKNRVITECRTIAVLMSEIMDIADSASNSVKLAPYYLFGRKMSLIQISMAIAALIEACENSD